MSAKRVRLRGLSVSRREVVVSRSSVEELARAARLLLDRITGMTSAEFATGGERPERERLRRALRPFTR